MIYNGLIPPHPPTHPPLPPSHHYPQTFCNCRNLTWTSDQILNQADVRERWAQRQQKVFSVKEEGMLTCKRLLVTYFFYRIMLQLWNLCNNLL